jgi:hypothetical protein
MNNFNKVMTDTSNNYSILEGSSLPFVQLQNPFEVLRNFYSSQVASARQLTNTQGIPTLNTPNFQLAPLQNMNAYSPVINNPFNYGNFYNYLIGSRINNFAEQARYNYSSSLSSPMNEIYTTLSAASYLQQNPFVHQQTMQNNKIFNDLISVLNSLNSLTNISLTNQHNFNFIVDAPHANKVIMGTRGENSVKNPSSEKSTLEVTKVHAEPVQKEPSIICPEKKNETAFPSGKISRIVKFKTKEIFMRGTADDQILMGKNEQEMKNLKNSKNLRMRSNFFF